MRLACTLLLALTACAPASLEPPARTQQPIIGGTPTGTADSEVFGLYVNGEFVCSSTLIHPRVLLTAAHCVIDGSLTVGNEPTSPQTFPHLVKRRWFNPRYQDDVLIGADVGLLLLDQPITTVNPKPIQREPLALDAGTPARAVGFGVTAAITPGQPEPPYGERRTLDVTLIDVTPPLLLYGGPGHSVCYGDSGGPLFATIDGVERVIGVHSFAANQRCEGGGASRVDLNLADLDAWITTNTLPACDTDGQCNPACPDQSLDADCDVDCGANGLCAAGPCLARDPDCAEIGRVCTSALQCATRLCFADTQHPKYCTRECTSAADCPTGMECDARCRYPLAREIDAGQPCVPGDFCRGDAVCHFEAPGFARCDRLCMRDSECPSDHQCLKGSSPTAACTPRAKTLKSVQTAKLPVVQQCSIGGSTSALLLICALLRRKP